MNLRDAAQAEFDKWAATFDLYGNEWQDMGFGEAFIKGYEVAALASDKPAEWVGLTDEERFQCRTKAIKGLQNYVRNGGEKPEMFDAIIEAALKEKNHG